MGFTAPSIIELQRGAGPINPGPKDDAHGEVTVSTMALVAVLIAETPADDVTYARVPSGVIAALRASPGMVTVVSSEFVVVSTTATRFAPKLRAAYRRVASGVRAIPAGRPGSPMSVMGLFVAPSRTWIVCPSDAPMYILVPDGFTTTLEAPRAPDTGTVAITVLLLVSMT